MDLMTLMMQAMGVGTSSWLQTVYLICLFATAVLRPERIISPNLFRYGCYLFACSILVPVILLQFGGYSGTGGNRGRNVNPMLPQFGGSSGMNDEYMRIISAIGPILFGISLILVFSAIVPTNRSAKIKDPPAPTKHPLDD